MKKKIHTYEGEDITVTYDVKRCIHAARCVRGLPEVFEPGKRPWITPDEASAQNVADVIESCPTGALHYEMKSSDRHETPASKNRVSLQKDGPVYLYGNIEIQDAEGTTLLEDTRVALCRCGASQNKPLCDNSHKEANFKADTDADTENIPEKSADGHERLILKVMENGPVLVEGSYTLESDSIEPHPANKNIALCRCGGSSNKPYCDGTHKKIGFQSA